MTMTRDEFIVHLKRMMASYINYVYTPGLDKDSELAHMYETIAAKERDAILAEYDRLTAEVAKWKRAAQEQSEEVQRDWLSPVEAKALCEALEAERQKVAALREIILSDNLYISWPTYDKNGYDIPYCPWCDADLIVNSTHKPGCKYAEAMEITK